MYHLIAFVMAILLALAVGGPALAKKFAHRLFVGNEIYVFLTIDGRLVCYKNPNSPNIHEDEPLLMVPYQILESSEFDTYFNVCWFDAGVLFRCEHSFHRTQENATYCQRNEIAGSQIGKVLERR